jgi:hypothetical protein
MLFTHTRRRKSAPAALFNPAIHGGEYRASRSDCSVPCKEHLEKRLEYHSLENKRLISLGRQFVYLFV